MSNHSFHPKDFGKVAVLAGGLSSEREISLMSGKGVFQALKNLQVDAHFIDVGEDVIEVLLQGQFDRAFIALHGRGGEDGSLQGALEQLRIPYTGSGVAASALAMDKLRSKLVWQSLGLPILPSIVVDETCDLTELNLELRFPLCVKPVYEGSSVGVSKVLDYKELPKAFELANQHDELVMIEEWVEGAEYTVGILADKVLPPLEIRVPEGFYDYTAKYKSHSTTYHCPCDLSKSEQSLLQDIAFEAYLSLGCEGWGRVDLMRDKEGDFYLLEVNTAPGLTGRSNVPMMAKTEGIEYDELILRILETSMDDE